MSRAAMLPPRAQALLVGGGVTGLSAARTLASQGVDTVLLESGMIPGPEARGVVPSLLLPGLALPYAVAVQVLGREPARRIWRATAEECRSLAGILDPSPFPATGSVRGHLEVATSDEEALFLRESSRFLAEDGLPAEWWPAERLRDEVGVTGSAGGFLDPSVTRADPTRLRGLLAEEASRHGAKLLSGCVVERIREEPSGEISVEAAGRTCLAEFVLLATNDSLPRLHHFLGDKFFPLLLVHAVFRIERDAPPFAVSLHDGQLSWTPLGRGELLAGAVLPADSRSVSTPGEIEALRTELRPFVPGIERAATIRQASSLEAYPCDGIPLVGRIPGQMRILIAGGYAGRGLALGQLAGRGLAEAILGRPFPAALEPLAPHRFL